MVVNFRMRTVFDRRRLFSCASGHKVRTGEDWSDWFFLKTNGKDLKGIRSLEMNFALVKPNLLLAFNVSSRRQLELLPETCAGKDWEKNIKIFTEIGSAPYPELSCTFWLCQGPFPCPCLDSCLFGPFPCPCHGSCLSLLLCFDLHFFLLSPCLDRVYPALWLLSPCKLSRPQIQQKAKRKNAHKLNSITV